MLWRLPRPTGRSWSRRAHWPSTDGGEFARKVRRPGKASEAGGGPGGRPRLLNCLPDLARLPWHPIICRMRLDHPDDHPDDRSASVGSRLDRRATQREQAESVWSRPGRRRSSELVIGRSTSCLTSACRPRRRFGIAKWQAQVKGIGQLACLPLVVENGYLLWLRSVSLGEVVRPAESVSMAELEWQTHLRRTGSYPGMDAA
jgi:hypothetical protein